MTPKQVGMLQELLDAEIGLSSWEMDFLDSLYQRDQGAGLTGKQATKLEQIWQKVFGG